MGGNVWHYVSDKRLVARIHRELSQLKNKKRIQLKCGWWTWRDISPGKTGSESLRCWALLVNERWKQIRRRRCLTSAGWLWYHKRNREGKDEWRTLGGPIKSEESCAWSSDSISKSNPKKNESTRLYQHPHKNACGCIIRGQDVGAAQMPWTFRQAVAQKCSGTTWTWDGLKI